MMSLSGTIQSRYIYLLIRPVQVCGVGTYVAYYTCKYFRAVLGVVLGAVLMYGCTRGEFGASA
jgi:hypothetical protein